MAVSAEDLKIVIRGVHMGQQMEVVQWYRPTGAAFLTATLLGVAEAYWNDIKTTWRACHVANIDDVTTSVFISEPGVAGQYAEFAVPSGEQQGTRSGPTEPQALPPYVAAGVRLTVGSRVTRPGQKRFWGLKESDQSNGLLTAALAALITSLAPKFAGGITLGAPVATGVLWAEIVRVAGVPQVVTARQDVTGFIVAGNVTTQNSRKFGRGA
jgi:hypothetical protein